METGDHLQSPSVHSLSSCAVTEHSNILNCSGKAKRTDQELKDEEMELFTKYYLEWKGGRKNATTSYMNIPRFYYREPFPTVMEGDQPGKSKSSGRAPRGPTWTDEETRVLLGHWNTLLVQRRVQNMPTNSDLYAVLAKKMAEEGFLRTRIQCNNRIRDLRKAYRKAKDAMGKAGAMPVRCRFFRELDEICGGETESVPSSMSQTMRLQPSTTMVQPGPSWEPIPEIPWKVEEDSEAEATFDGISDAPETMQEVLKIKVESELEEAAAFQLPLQPVSSSSSSTVVIAPSLEEDQQSAFQEPDILMPATTRTPQPLSPTCHSEQRLKTGIHDRIPIGRTSHDPQPVARSPVATANRIAQMRARRRRTREETIGRLLGEIRAGREAMDTTFRLFLEQQRSFQKSLIREMRLARQEQRRATEAELRARQEEWQQQRTQQVLDVNRTDAEIVRFRQELSLLRHTFMEFLSGAKPFPTASQLRTPSSVPAQREGLDPSGSHWEGFVPTASPVQAPLPASHALRVPSRGRRGRPRKRGGAPKKQVHRE
ncbi:serine/threonine-protein phosphatase 2A regulatory subunit B'' subunit gamma isoform X3 [Hemicordylus capensis]|uniref:serine/threonine-protein phosphatase 2A regulatory subunit B'' subunit gamma isoform X3 n=1 Tax=Hemicordylus capensis TaxID=884348 RepID=UPI0023025133|nr:serine/threonine-protein phosphatase 2A regulatory subunit B'' subunit gamma isoform X3 [Hemicordylus capensis]XP_053110621.1 serine/threonine-protein phosphatase 2A regulatory subunit B'' subunit gamma isoform X3 [Hemicordylus capensis]